MSGRRAWARNGYGHIEVRGDSAPLLAQLEALDGVYWAAWNGILGRLVVRFDESTVRLSQLVRIVSAAEPTATEPTAAELTATEPAATEPAVTVQHAAAPQARRRDIEPLPAAVIALVGDLAAAGLGLLGRALRVPPAPSELTALPAAWEHLARPLDAVRSLVGARRTDLAVGLVASVASAATQTMLTPLADAGVRLGLIAETVARRNSWAVRAKDLFADAGSSRAASPPALALTRPAPLPDGPIEQYARRIRTVTLVAAGAMMALPGRRRRALRAVALGSPRAARLGREAYAARLGQALSRQGVVVRDPAALRRLDRIDTVVVDAAVLTTGRRVVAHVVPVRGSAEAARDRAAGLLDGEPQPGWALHPLGQVEPVAEDLLTQLRRSRRGDELALVQRDVTVKEDVLVALVRVEAELTPHASALAAAARRVGRFVVAGARPAVAQRLNAHARVAGGARLADSVRALQRDGRAVAVVATRNDTALLAADCGVGILTRGRRPPWGAHLLCGPGAETAWLVLEAAVLARLVSGRSARLALLGSAAGALVGLTDRRALMGRRALLATGTAAVATVVSGVWSARTVGRRRPPVPEDLVPWHALAVDEALRRLGSSPAGLSAEQVVRRREHNAPAPAPRTRSLLSATVSELDTPLTAPLVAGAGVSAASGSTIDAALVFSVLVANAMLSAVQAVSADRAARRLVRAAALRVRLHRAAGVTMASAGDLVPGDIVLLEPGDAVPADARLIEAAGLEIDESALTGESMPVAKMTAAILAAIVADRRSMVYAGTTVAAGTAKAVVVATGPATEAGRSATASGDEEPRGGVQEHLRRMTAASIPAAVAAGVAVLGSGLARGRLRESLSSAVALAVAAIPEGLPSVATVAQVSASRRLSRRNILVRDHRAMEALGRVDTVCFDKTGTLTEGRIQVRTVSDGRVQHPVTALDQEHREILAAALRASPAPEGGQALPHPTDRAVVVGAQGAGVGTGDGAAGWRLLRELPFEPGRGFHAVLGSLPHGHLISVKGAPEVLLPRCDTWRHDGVVSPLSTSDRHELVAEVDRLARRGLRVLAVAERAASTHRHLDEDRVDRLEMQGLIGLSDPTRPSAAQAVRRLQRAGITVMMLTGDHPSTAEAIGAELALVNGHAVVTGADLDDADEETLHALVSKAAVFARVSPAHKVAVVRALRSAGHVVAVTGDGANDAPAIRLADVGIALGDQGTSAARQAADIIVVDGKIETIADGVIEGRAMWASVRDAVALLLGGNLGEIFFAVGSSMMAERPPLNTRQILFVNLMTDLLPALSVAARPPRRVTPESLAREGPESSLGETLTRDVARRAAVTGLATMAAWLVARYTGTPRRASTVALAALVGAQLAQTAVASQGDLWVLAAAGASTAALVGAVQTPFVSGFFGCRPLGPIAWATVGCAAVAAAVAGAV